MAAGAAGTVQPTNPRAPARAARFALRNTLRQITTIRRHQGCGRYLVRADSSGRVQVRLGGEGHVAHYSGVQLCGHIWTCPVCSPRVRQARALDVDAAAETWLTRNGPGSVMLLTLTLPHAAGERLAAVLGAVRRAFSLLVAGRAWQQDKATFGLRHYIRAHDLTVGRNGWHPHLHILLFVGAALDADQVAALRARLYDRWRRAVMELDRDAPTAEHGINLTVARNREDVTRYVCQVVADGADGGGGVAMEVTRGDLKKSHRDGQRAPFQLLEDYAANFAMRDRGLWREYETATRGVKAIRWSNGLRAAVDLGAELTDEQIVMEEIGGAVLHEFTPPAWRAFRDRRGIRIASAAAELLQHAEAGGAAGVRSYLRDLEQAGTLDRLDRLLYLANSGGSTRDRGRLSLIAA